jgi:hypothetical protein
VFGGERLAVELIGEEGVGIERLFQRNGALKIGHGSERHVGAIEKNFLRRVFEAGAAENIAQAGAAPAHVPHSAISPLHAGNRWLIKRAAVSGALNDAHQRDGRKLLHIVEGESERSGHFSGDGETPLAGVYGGHVDMRADEQVFRGGEVIGEAGERHFEIFGTDGARQHVPLGPVIGPKQSTGGHPEQAAAGNLHCSPTGSYFIR